MPAARFRVGRARAGLGLFATAPIARGSFIIEYTGKRLTTKAAHEREWKTGARYMFEVSERVTIDGSSRANTARYINHSCKPNAEAVISGGRIRIYARKRIAEGQEITMDYGIEYFEMFIGKACRCERCAA
jgi:SET domain-containing protein